MHPVTQPFTQPGTQPVTQPVTKNGATLCNMEQNGAKWCKTDVRADVLNPMIFIKCNVFNTKAELIHL